MALRPSDFKSDASASSTTMAYFETLTFDLISRLTSNVSQNACQNLISGKANIAGIVKFHAIITTIAITKLINGHMINANNNDTIIIAILSFMVYPAKTQRIRLSFL